MFSRRSALKSDEKLEDEEKKRHCVIYDNIFWKSLEQEAFHKKAHKKITRLTFKIATS